MKGEGRIDVIKARSRLGYSKQWVIGHYGGREHVSLVGPGYALLR